MLAPNCLHCTSILWVYTTQATFIENTQNTLKICCSRCNNQLQYSVKLVTRFQQLTVIQSSFRHTSDISALRNQSYLSSKPIVSRPTNHLVSAQFNLHFHRRFVVVIVQPFDTVLGRLQLWSNGVYAKTLINSYRRQLSSAVYWSQPGVLQNIQFRSMDSPDCFVISYHIISEIYSAPITKRAQAIGALQKSAEC